MKFIAIDSSLSNTGVTYGTIENDIIQVDGIELIETSKTKNKQVRASSDTVSRCRETYTKLTIIIKGIEPDVIFMETPSGSQNASGMKSYGATCQLIAALNPEPIEVTPHEVKMASVNDKKASKEKMITWAINVYPHLSWLYHAGKLQAKNEHMADAIAIAYAGIETAEFKRLQHYLKK